MKGLNSEGTRESIKELFDNFAKVRFVDYNKGNPEAFVRFAEENNAKEALAKALEASGEKNAIVLKEATIECRVLEGDEENEYWTTLIRKLAESRSNKHGRHMNSNNRRRRNDNGYNKNKSNKNKRSLDDGSDGEENDRGEDNDAEENQSKKIKAE